MLSGWSASQHSGSCAVVGQPCPELGELVFQLLAPCCFLCRPGLRLPAPAGFVRDPSFRCLLVLGC